MGGENTMLRGSPAQRAIALCAIFIAMSASFLIFTSIKTAAQKPSGNASQGDLFDNLMRSGKLPFEFKVSMSRTAATGLGPYIGTITVLNTMIKIGGRDEPALLLKADLINLTPGPHAFHIHEYPDCGAKLKDGVMVPGLAAGAHLFAEHQEGSEIVIYKSHLGSLPNLIVDAYGTTREEVIAPRLALADLVNRSIMIHATADDNSARVACGVFK
jgi:superoxide dismutase, Cu-Zn family